MENENTNPIGQPGAGAEGVSENNASSATENNNPNQGTESGHFIDISRDGESIKLSKERAIEYAQKGFDYTKKLQAFSEKEKAWQKEREDYIKQLNSVGQSQGDEGNEGDEDVVGQLTNRLSGIESKLADSELERSMRPIREKYPHLTDDMVFARFASLADQGKVHSNIEGLEQAAKSVNDELSGSIEKKLESLITSDDPKAVAIRNKIIEEYRTGKIKLINSGGEPGGGSGSVKPKEINSLEDAVLASRNAHIPQ